ncbi:hypothetical protein [Parapedobacter tibetensis]|nr:hypothetical protein [Parapedobacter tibetensis]
MNKLLKTLKSIIRPFNKKPLRRLEPYKVNYHEKWLLPPLAVFVGIFIVLYAHHRSFGEAIFMLAFYKAAIPSVLSAWVVMWSIVQVTYVLDDTHPWAIRWYRGPLNRMLLQLGFGIVMPGFFIFGVFAIYFLVRGHADRIIRYALEDFPFVLLMFLGFNVLAWVYYRLRTVEIMHKFRKWGRDHGKSDKEMERRWQEGSMDVVPGLDKAVAAIALLEPYSKENNTCFCTYLDGKTDKEPYTMKDFFAKHEGYHFHRPRPEIILNRAAIREVYKLGKDVVIILDQGRPGEEITVSVRKRNEFLAWWEEGAD